MSTGSHEVRKCQRLIHRLAFLHSCFDTMSIAVAPLAMYMGPYILQPTMEPPPVTEQTLATKQMPVTDVPPTSTTADPQDATGLVLSGYSKLPAELRELVWKFFCPDIDIENKKQPHVFQVVVSGCCGAPLLLAEPPSQVEAGFFLADQTRALRTALAINSETRELALRMFPHTFTIDHVHKQLGRTQCLVRFDRDRDIVLIHNKTSNCCIDDGDLAPMCDHPMSATWAMQFSKEVRNVALGVGHWRMWGLWRRLPFIWDTMMLEAMVRDVRHLQTFYLACAAKNKPLPQPESLAQGSFELSTQDRWGGRRDVYYRWWTDSSVRDSWMLMHRPSILALRSSMYREVRDRMGTNLRLLLYHGYDAVKEADNLDPSLLTVWAYKGWVMLKDIATRNFGS